MLKAESVHKRFPTRAGELTVLRDVSFTLDVGESAVVLGPSGSGKSTLLNILGTLEPPTEGRVLLDGCDPFSLPPRELARFRNRSVGFIFQDHHLLPQCELSGGEKQRVAIARALINRPKLLLADEPTGNLDRKTAERVGTLLTELHRAEGQILLVVTHSEALAERFARRYELVDGTLKAC